MSSTLEQFHDDDDEEDLTDRQVERALDGLTYDTTGLRRLRFRPNGLHNIARYMVAGQLVILAAGTGIGKTTSLLSFADDFLMDGARVAYLGLEMEDHELRTAFACLRARVPRWMAVENSWAEHADGREMAKQVMHQLFAQKKHPLRDQLLFLPHRLLDKRTLVDAAKQAGKFKADVLVVDHINHGKAGSYGEWTDLVHLSKSVAEDYGFVNLSAAQVNREAVRGGHRLTRYQPMQLHHIQGGGVIEQNAVMVLNPYRPIVTGTDPTTQGLIKKAMKGEIEPTFVLQKDRMGIAVLKHRVRGELEGQRCVLKLEHGKLVDL